MSFPRAQKPTAFGPKLTQPPTAQQWLAMKPHIRELYEYQDLKLREVMEKMKQEHDFDATKKMYKARITAWGLGKNNRVGEAQAILQRKRAVEATGYQCLFLVRGRLVDMADVERCCKRAKSNAWANATNLDAPLPAGVICILLEQGVNAITDPDVFKHFRSCLHYAAVYMDSGFDRGIWRSIDADQALDCNSTTTASVYIAFFNELNYARLGFRSGQYALGGTYARLACSRIPAILTSDYDEVMFLLLRHLKAIVSEGLILLHHTFVRLMAEFASICLPPSHPFQQYFASLSKCGAEWTATLCTSHSAAIVDNYIRRLGRHHLQVLYLEYEAEFAAEILEVAPWGEIQAKTQSADSVYGERSMRSCYTYLKISQGLIRAGRWIEAEILLNQLRHKMKSIPQPSLPCRTGAHILLFQVQTKLCNFQDARHTAEEALRIFDWNDKSTRPCLLHVLEYLCWICFNLGDVDAAQYHDKQLREAQRQVMDQDALVLASLGVDVPPA